VEDFCEHGIEPSGSQEGLNSMKLVIISDFMEVVARYRDKRNCWLWSSFGAPRLSSVSQKAKAIIFIYVTSLVVSKNTGTFIPPLFHELDRPRFRFQTQRSFKIRRGIPLKKNAKPCQNDAVLFVCYTYKVKNNLIEEQKFIAMNNIVISLRYVFAVSCTFFKYSLVNKLLICLFQIVVFWVVTPYNP
jgi:hypothetical protein